VAIANALQLEAARLRAVPIRFNTSPVASFKSLSLSVAVLERFYCLYVTLRCDLELWPRDLDLWPWTFVVRWLCRNETLYEILISIRQSAAELLQFEVWPFDLEHVPRVALCSEILYTKFKLGQAIRSRNVTIFFTLIRHIMLWPWPLTRWPWKFVVDLVARGHSLY